MTKNKNWFGVDASNEVSLFEQGFLMRWIPKYKEYQVVYINGKNVDGSYNFSFSWFDFSEWMNDIKNNIISSDSFPETKSLASMCGMNAEEWIDIVQESPQNLLSDLLSYYGNDDIFGTDYSGGFTEKEIRKRLNKAILN